MPWRPAGVLTWVNRIARIREWGPDLFGRAQNRWRVIRTSNAYVLIDPKPSKSNLPTGTEGQELILSASTAVERFKRTSEEENARSVPRMPDLLRG
jgi:hypothetical protein